MEILSIAKAGQKGGIIWQPCPRHIIDLPDGTVH